MPDTRPADQSDHPITVYWRPGCGFCASLLRGLDQSGLQFQRADIWEDEDAAAYVRSVARGNETVPTVRIGDTALVNPSAQQVLATVAAEAPDQLPEGYVPPQPGKVTKVITKLLGG
jgi:glutaredoxin-like protein